MTSRCVACEAKATQMCVEVVDGKVCGKPLCSTCTHSPFLLPGAGGTLHDHVTAEKKAEMIERHLSQYKKRA